jgi:hypothetical protein
VASTCQPIPRKLRVSWASIAASRAAGGAPSRVYDVPVTAPDGEAAPATSGEDATRVVPDEQGRAFLESLMDTELYSMGAFFCDEHPDLVEEVTERSVAIERQGLEAYARASGTTVEETFGTLLTGLAVRYYKAVAG